jgi:uncharacterized Zn-binding protein involved in type VI secretion
MLRLITRCAPHLTPKMVPRTRTGIALTRLSAIGLVLVGVGSALAAPSNAAMPQAPAPTLAPPASPTPPASPSTASPVRPGRAAIARAGDMHVCPMVAGVLPHTGGPISQVASAGIMACGQPVAAVGDLAVCVGPPDRIVTGSESVVANGKKVARLGDLTAHGGRISAGCQTVMVGH